MHIVIILHWYQLVITYRVGYHVRFRDISAQQRGRKYYIFPTWYKNKKVITGLCPKPGTANFRQRNRLLFSRHLPCLLLRAITFYLNFGFWILANPVAIFCYTCHYFAASLDHNHCWSRIILLRLCLVARLEIQTWLNTNVNEYTKQSNAEKRLSVFFLIKVLFCYNYPTMRQNCGGGLFSHLSLFGKGRLDPTGS